MIGFSFYGGFTKYHIARRIIMFTLLWTQCFLTCTHWHWHPSVSDTFGWCPGEYLIYHLQGAKLPASDYIKNCSWKIWNTPNSYPYSTYIDLKSLCALAHAQWQLLCSLIQTVPIVSVSWINNCLNMLIGEKNRKKHFLRNVTNQNLLFNWKATHASTRKF